MNRCVGPAPGVPEKQEGDALNPVTQQRMVEKRLDADEAASPRFESIEELFLAIESPLLIYARRLARDISLAEDLVQEAFLRLQPQFHQIASPRSWLYRTVHNLAINHHRDNAKIVSFGKSTSASSPTESHSEELADPADPHPLPDDQIARWEGVGLVRLNLLNLDPRSQEIIRLRFLEDFSYQEISDRTGLKIGHVGYLLHHALKTLAADLSKAGLVP